LHGSPLESTRQGAWEEGAIRNAHAVAVLLNINLFDVSPLGKLSQNLWESAHGSPVKSSEFREKHRLFQSSARE